MTTKSSIELEAYLVEPALVAARVAPAVDCPVLSKPWRPSQRQHRHPLTLLTANGGDRFRANRSRTAILPTRPIVSASIYTRDTNRAFSPMCDMDTDVDSSRKLRRAPIDTSDS